MDFQRMYSSLNKGVENYAINAALPKPYICGLDDAYETVVMIDDYYDKLKENCPKEYSDQYHRLRRDHADYKFSRIVLFNYK